MKPIIRRYRSVMHGNYKKASLKYGLYMALVLSFLLLLRYLAGYAPDATTENKETWTVFAGLAIMNIVFTFHYRKRVEGKKISFKEAFLLGLYGSLVACVLYALFMYFYASCIDNGENSFESRTIELLTRQTAQANNIDISQVKLPSMSYLVFYGMVVNMVMSVLVSFFSAIVCRNEKSPTA